MPFYSRGIRFPPRNVYEQRAPVGEDSEHTLLRSPCLHSTCSTYVPLPSFVPATPPLFFVAPSPGVDCWPPMWQSVVREYS
eukprot:1934446-Pyramimonas_sp.AAC.2